MSLIDADKAKLISAGFPNLKEFTTDVHKRRKAMLEEVSRKISDNILKSDFIYYIKYLRDYDDGVWLQNKLEKQKYKVTSWASGENNKLVMSIAWRGTPPNPPLPLLLKAIWFSVGFAICLFITQCFLIAFKIAEDMLK